MTTSSGAKGKRYYVCLNQISYVVACEHLEKMGGDAVVLFDPVRVRLQRRYSHRRAIGISRAAVGRRILFSIWQRPQTIFVPHHRTGWLLRLFCRLAITVHLIDDGMDTLRDVPRNIDHAQLARECELLTFTDYAELGRWTDAVRCVRVCSIDILQADDRPALETHGFDTLVVESPGVHFPDRDMGLQSPTIYIAHPSYIKNREPPPNATVILPGEHSVERTLASFSGRVVVGETMILPFLLLSSIVGSLDIVVQLSRTQYINLRSLHSLLLASGADVQVH